MSDLIRDYFVAEFRGDYPQIETDGRVNLEELTAGDENPFFVTLPISEVGATSKSGLVHDEELVGTLEQQMVGKGGIMGHIKPEERATAFPVETVDWIGVKRQGSTLWAKGYIPPGEAREYIRRLKARGGSLATSIYGKYREKEPLGTGRWKARDMRLESVDLAPPDRAALALDGGFLVTAQMEGNDMTRDEVLAELTANDVPGHVRNAIIQEWQQDNEGQARLAELTQERDDALALVNELQGQVQQHRDTQFNAALDGRIAELVNWQATGEEAQGKVDALKRTLRARILSELDDKRDEKALAETIDRVWAEMQPLAEIIRDALAGPPAVVAARVAQNGVHKLEDTPEARRAARARVGL